MKDTVLKVWVLYNQKDFNNAVCICIFIGETFWKKTRFVLEKGKLAHQKSKLFSVQQVCRIIIQHGYWV